MNVSALKSFAPDVRRQLIEAVGRKLDFVLNGDTADLRAAAAQVTRLRQQAKKDRAGLIDRVAYTWFNRLTALRFLDARGWHPFLARVLTPATAEETQPELLKLTRTGGLPAELAPFTNPARLNDLLDGRLPSPDPQGEVYRHLVLAACRFYHDLMPFLFEALDDETELLLPDDLLTGHSIAHGFRTEITDTDCAEVEILGWLYQFYISERKDQVMARKSAVPNEDIPAVTQLFTPHWIVRYLVENSLGRLWLGSRPGSRLREHMPYYVDDPEGQPPPDSLTGARPEDIRLLDPACGSGHMLTYAFDLLSRIYEEEGHSPSEIPALILRHNLYGLEICPRATQLAQFALVCKAREKSRSAFRSPVQPQVVCLEDVEFTPEEMTTYLRLPGLRELFTEQSWMFLSSFEDLRTDLLRKRVVHNMAHLGARAFDSIGGEVVQATAFICENVASPEKVGIYLRLTEGRSEAEKAAACREAISNPNCRWLFRASGNDFKTIPGSPISYWLSEKALNSFRADSFLSGLAPIREGINTGDNDRFLRFWFEVRISKIDFETHQNALPKRKWVGCGYFSWVVLTGFQWSEG